MNALHQRAWEWRLSAAVCVVAGALLFHFFGNANRGYIDSSSLFYWWGVQWVNPGSETEHGWLILALSAWLFARNLRANREQGAGREGRADRPDCLAEAIPTDPAAPRAARPYLAPLAAMLAGLALHTVGFAAQQGRISILALLVFLWGVLRLAGGERWGRAALFPLGFMVFAIPFNALDSIGFWLRVWVIDAGTWLAHAAGIPVLKNGTQLVAPDGRYNYDVAAACSGIRSLTALAALSLLSGYFHFRSWRRRALVLLLCFPLVYLGNVARIIAIIFAAQLGGQAWGERAHEIMGFGVFAIVLGGVLAASAALQRWWPEEGRSAETRPEDAETRGRGDAEGGGQGAEGGGRRSEVGGRAADVQGRIAAGSLPCDLSSEVPRAWETKEASAKHGGWRADIAAAPAAVAAVIIAVAAAEAAFLDHLATSPPRGRVGVVLTGDGLNPVELPAFLGIEWTGRPTPVTAVEREVLPPDTGFSRKIYLNHRDPTKAVLLSIVLSGRDRTSIHRPELCLIGQGWTIAGRADHRFAHPGSGGGSFPATLLHVQRQVQTPRGSAVVPQVVAYWFVYGDGVVATHWQRLLRDGWNRVVRARTDRWAYVLIQTDAQDGEKAALARIEAVLAETLPIFQPVAAARMIAAH
jgi:EpsI family protein